MSPPPWLTCLLSVAGVGGCTLICFRLNQNPASVGFFYLIFVVLSAVYGGFWQATLVSLLSVACLDYFFNEPIFSLSVAKLSDWVELAAFEFTAMIVTQLSNRAQCKAQEAEAERRDTARLYQAARRLLLLNDSGNPGHPVAMLIQETFELQGVVLIDRLSDAVYRSTECPAEVERQARAACLTDADMYDPEGRNWFCILRLGPRASGAVALCGTEMTHLTASALASLCAIALERSASVERQNHADALRQAEQLRTAVLDALAHKFKTPLTVIRTASSGIPAAGSLSELQADLVCLIDQEAGKLNDLASRLLCAPNLDATEFAPESEPVLLSKLVHEAIDELDQQVDRDRFEMKAPGLEPPVFADKELILTALSQLVDNALKYSFPGSPIDATVRVQDSAVVLAMRSRGLVVAQAECERIFERFHRAPGAQHYANGTGLGLSIVKTIARDHQGSVWAEGEPGCGTTFSFSLPTVGVFSE